MSPDTPDTTISAQEQRPCWFVGSSFGGKDDQTERFIRDKIWETNRDKAREQIQAAQPGDRIAIKATYTRKNNLPFDCNGNAVSVMAIKATGTVLANLGNGRLSVDWTPCEPVREWYFFTFRETVWKVSPGMWATDALIAFAFEGKGQDIERFRNDPFWFLKYGDKTRFAKKFTWMPFYMKVADRLLTYRDRREELVRGIHAIAAGKEYITVLQDRSADGTRMPLTDICPFTVMALFNRGIRDENRTQLARELAHFLGVTEQVPTSFEAIPTVNNQSTWFFSYADKRKPDDIEKLWEVFARAIAYADNREGYEEARAAFCEAYDAALGVSGVKWNLSIGLYWARPWCYMPLDACTRRYISEVAQHQICLHTQPTCSNASDYLDLVDELLDKSSSFGLPAYSMLELVLAAQVYVHNWGAQGTSEADEADMEDTDTKPALSTYSAQSIVDEGCFVPKPELDTMLERLREKKNLILQGPPGTGKTWLAKRLAYALTGERDDSRMRAVQFHPSLSYEDFVRGWRPAGNGQLTLTDGPFMEMVELAHSDPAHLHIVLIEEINRGNPAQILGEMLTLLEADKRNQESALTLLYRKEQGERVYLPPNLYIIGTMNIADRSLALVDLTLRRRFAFVNLLPRVDGAWQKWVHDTCGMPMEILDLIRQNMQELNDTIASDRHLGPQFQVGHSYVTPRPNAILPDPAQWFRDVVWTEIFPLLEEYWYDNPDRARDARDQLLKGF